MSLISPSAGPARPRARCRNRAGDRTARSLLRRPVPGSGRDALTAFAGFAGVMAAMSVAATAFHDAHGSGIFNLLGARNAAEPRSGGYSAETAYAWLNLFGEDGRRDHLLILLLDLPLMAAFGAFAYLTLRWAVPGAGRRLRAAFLILPLAAVAANLAEDLGLAVLLVGHPARMDALAVTVSGVNSLKSTLYTVSFAAVIVAPAARPVLRARARRRRG
jgi:hypothetical protein